MPRIINGEHITGRWSRVAQTSDGEERVLAAVLAALSAAAVAPGTGG